MTCIDIVMQVLPENCSTGKGLALATGTSKHEITKVLNGDISLDYHCGCILHT